MNNLETTTVLDNGRGTITWYGPNELTPRRERQLQTEVMPLRRLMAAIEDPNYPITKAEVADLLAVNEIAVVIFLKSWTIVGENGAVVPLPTTADAILDVEDLTGIGGLYDHLIGHAAKLVAARQGGDGGFTVDSVEDPKAPTGGSAD